MNFLQRKEVREWIPMACLVVACILFMWALQEVAGIFFLAWFLAYLVRPAVVWLEKRKISRSLALLITFSLIAALLSVFIFFVAPQLVREAIQLSKELPQQLPKLWERLQAWLPYQVRANLNRMLNWNQLQNLNAGELAQNIIPAVFKSAKGVWNLAMQILLISLLPIFFIYALLDFEKIREQFYKFIPVSKRSLVRSYLDELNDRFYKYFRGMFVVALSLAVMYGVGLSISGVPFGFLIGVSAGILSFIPYLGSILGFIAAVIVTSIYDPTWAHFIGIGITWTVSQTIESYLLTPKLVGKEVGMNPLLVILLVIAGANVAGFIGMFVAIPVGSFLWFVLKEVLNSNGNKTAVRQGQ